MPGSIIDFSNLKNPWTSSSSSSGLPTGPARTTISNSVQSLGNSIPSWQSALGKAAGLPGKIDTWANERMKHQYIGADDWSNALGAVARQRASAGIMGGTETNNLRAGVTSRLIQDLLSRQDQIRSQADQMKYSNMMTMPQLYAQPAQTMGGLAQLLSRSQAQAYQEDPSATADVIARLLIAGFTGG